METNTTTTKETDVVIIGGGQAGLSVGRYLKEYKKDFVILDKNSEIGSSWKNRYDSLVLDSYAKYGSLDGFPFPGDDKRRPAKDEVASYLKSFADHFGVTIEHSVEVLKIEKKDNKFITTTNKGMLVSNSVVLATGPFNKPYMPSFAQEISKDIYQIHSEAYKNPGMLKDGKTLVVGKGNSGSEIAEELVLAGREVLFSFRGKYKSTPSAPFSQWMAYSAGLAHVPKHTWLGKMIVWYTSGKSVGVDSEALLKNPKLETVGDCNAVEDGKIICSGKKIEQISNIIWATGYQSDFSIVSIPYFNPDTQKRGVTNIPGLYVLNIRWQYTKSSSHLAGVSRDAKYIAKYIAKN